MRKALTSLLIANRGEIAVRVIRTARDMGISTIAVYSDADARSLHVEMADQAIHIGASPATDSYLRSDRIIEAAISSGADAIHPGYGFLSENADFSNAVEEAGLIFVGPPSDAISIMADKAHAKRRMIEAGVPCIPGYQGEDQSDEVLKHHAIRIGLPVMVKAAAGGGGKGMRLVAESSELSDAIKVARLEAENAFGNGDLILEKAVGRPRHVEIQIFADTFGNVVHFGERDCSVQRRHQKVIEEAPCPVISADLRAQMGKAAIEAAKAVNYRGAGTVEFLLDQDQKFYFLEMNTRLQVEHPVTEMITDTDLVALQLRVARGEPLGVTQSEISISGHAIEARLYAENPSDNFLPSTGPVELLKFPKGEGVRVDTGLSSEGEVSPYYDPMVAKLIAHGPDRESARLRLYRALSETVLIGPETNRDFLMDVLFQEDFAIGAINTAFVQETYGDQGYLPSSPSLECFAAAAALQYVLAMRGSFERAPDVSEELLGWSGLGQSQSVFIYRIERDEITFEVQSRSQEKLQVTARECSWELELIDLTQDEALFQMEGRRLKLHFLQFGRYGVQIMTSDTSFKIEDVKFGDFQSEENVNGLIRAPMHGTLTEILVKKGRLVAKGDKLAVLEAMKMQHEIVASIDGKIIRIDQAAGSQVSAGDAVMLIESASGEGSDC